MAERSLSMREAPGSIPGLSIPALQVGGLYSSVGQSARLVSARSGVRTSLEATFLLMDQNYCAEPGSKKISPSLWLGPSREGRARRGSNTRPLDLQSNALPTAPQAQVMPGAAILALNLPWNHSQRPLQGQQHDGSSFATVTRTSNLKCSGTAPAAPGQSALLFGAPLILVLSTSQGVTA